jgi:hypothetical protein
MGCRTQAYGPVEITLCPFIDTDGASGVAICLEHPEDEEKTAHHQRQCNEGHPHRHFAHPLPRPAQPVVEVRQQERPQEEQEIHAHQLPLLRHRLSCVHSALNQRAVVAQEVEIQKN